MVDIATGSVIDALAEERRLIGAAHLSPDGACAHVPDRVDEIDNLMNLAVIDTGSGGPGESSALELRAAPSQLAAGLSCGAVCSQKYAAGAVVIVTLTANATPGAVFVESGGCPLASGTTCSLGVTRPTTVFAVFTQP